MAKTKINADAIYSTIMEALQSDEYEGKGVMTTAQELFRKNQQAQELMKRLKEAKKRYNEHMSGVKELPIEEAVVLEDEVFELEKVTDKIFNLILEYVCKHRKAYNPTKDWYFHSSNRFEDTYEFRSNYYVQGSQIVRHVHADSLNEAWDKLTPPNI